MPERDPLERIVDLLDRHHQRATYGAVAGHLGRVARSLMQGRAPAQRYSWLVAKKTGEPTSYPSEHVHPALKERTRVLTTREELEEWLEAVTPEEPPGGDGIADDGRGAGEREREEQEGGGVAERPRGFWMTVVRIVAVAAGAWRFVTGR